MGLGIIMRIQVGRRVKAGTKNCLFKIQIPDFFQPVPAASLAGKRGEMAWCKCTGKESGAEWGI